MDNLIDNLFKFCELELQNSIVDLEKNRFKNNGEFNDHKRWEDNQKGKRSGKREHLGSYYSWKTVEQDKGFNKPLVDSGNLERQLTTAYNWQLNPRKNNNSLRFTVPEDETFTDKVYDKLEKEQGYQKYISPRNNLIELDYVPARPFKDFSQMDIDWLRDELVKKIKNEFKG